MRQRKLVKGFIVVCESLDGFLTQIFDCWWIRQKVDWNLSWLGNKWSPENDEGCQGLHSCLSITQGATGGAPIPRRLTHVRTKGCLTSIIQVPLATCIASLHVRVKICFALHETEVLTTKLSSRPPVRHYFTLFDKLAKHSCIWLWSSVTLVSCILCRCC